MGREQADLLEFLKALTGEIPPNVGPPATGPSASLQLLQRPQ